MAGAGQASGPPGAARPRSDLADHLAGVVGDVVDPALLERALTHRSYAYEAGGLPHNERLEFLGDSVLGLVVTQTLYDDHPDDSEGQLARLRAAVVNMKSLADVARTLGLGDHLLLGRGEDSSGGRDKDSLLADATEALIGAVHLSAGAAGSARLVHHLLDPVMAASAELGAALDWKTSLQEISAELGAGAPLYAVTSQGPEHEKWFTATVTVGDQQVGRGEGRTKKDAEIQAAQVGWTTLRERRDQD